MTQVTFRPDGQKSWHYHGELDEDRGIISTAHDVSQELVGKVLVIALPSGEEIRKRMAGIAERCDDPRTHLVLEDIPPRRDYWPPTGVFGIWH